MDALCPETPGKFSKCILQRGVGRDNLVNVTPQRASLLQEVITPVKAI